MRTIRTDAVGWQLECRRLAKANKRFEIHGVETRRHLAFIVEICEAHKFKAMRTDHIATLTPKVHQ